MMTFSAAKAEVYNRGRPSDAFLEEQVEWARRTNDSIFAPRPAPPPPKEDPDIYARIKPILGPWESLVHRKAAMLEVQRVLAGFESSWDHNEGVDISRLGDDTPENSEAGAWQVSYDARRLAPELAALCKTKGIIDGVGFQRMTKNDHEFAMLFVAQLMRVTWRHNGPLYRGAERNNIRASLRDDKHSIYPWLRRDAVAEFQSKLI